jgi:hypothetical protein
MKRYMVFCGRDYDNTHGVDSFCGSFYDYDHAYDKCYEWRDEDGNELEWAQILDIQMRAVYKYRWPELVVRTADRRLVLRDVKFV